MAYLSARDRRARKSRRRFLRPVLGVIFAILVTSVLIFLAFQKPAPPPAPIDVAEAATPSPEDLRREELSRLQSDLSAAARQNDPAKLEAAARAILTLDPQDEQAWGTLGRLQLQQGDYSSALVSLSKAVEFSDNKTSLLATRAGVHRTLGDFPAALADLEVAARLDPGNVEVANRLLIFKIQSGHAGEVRSYVATYEQAAITSQAPHWLLGAAALSMQDGDPGKAAKYLSSLKALLSPEKFSELLADPFFEPYHQDRALQAYFLTGSEMAP